MTDLIPLCFSPPARWCILRTTGARTIPLVRSLMAAGIEAWTPSKTIRREMGQHRRRSEDARRIVEVAAPIIPTIVFARAVHLHELAVVSSAAVSPHPGFSIFRYAGRVPLVGDRDIVGLKVEEAEQAELYQRLLDCESREERRRERAMALNTLAARRRALRMVRKDFSVGTTVRVSDAPAFAGKDGKIAGNDGTSAMVDFGGPYPIKVEAWQIMPVDVDGEPAA